MLTPVDLSVVIPTRNTRDLTIRCLDSVRASSSRAAEIIVVDDASGDGTGAAIGARHPDVTVMRFDTPAGFTAAANAGLRRASREVLLLLNSDTEVEQGSLDALSAAFTARPTLGIAGAQLFYPDGRAQWSGGALPAWPWLLYKSTGWHAGLARLPVYRRVRPLDGETDRAVGWVTGAAMAVRRAVWDAVGPLDERYRLYCSDLDYCCRARLAGWTVAVIAGCRVRHHQGATVQQVFDAAGREHAAQMWVELGQWVSQYRGAPYAHRLLYTAAAAARLRLRTRRVIGAAVPSARRPQWEDGTRLLELNLSALREASTQAARQR